MGSLSMVSLSVSFCHWFASSTSPCSAFVATASFSNSRVIISRRHSVHSLGYQIQPDQQDRLQQRQPQQQQHQVAPWFYGHLAETNILKLKSALLHSHVSTDGISRILDAIQTASKSDMNKMAGAAEFCHILVHVMEMGNQIDALIAAAYHYCSCVSAREREAVRRVESDLFFASASNDVQSLDDELEQIYFQPLSGIGPEATEIAMDAARLKRIETTASSLLHHGGASKAIHDPNEAEIHRRLILTVSGDWRALAIRSAACLYRLYGVEAKHMHDYTTPHLTRDEVRICREALHIYSPLSSRMGMHRLKNKMDDLAFRLLYPRQYATASSIYQRQKHLNGNGMRKLLDELTIQMKEMLKDDPVLSKYASIVSVCGRTKEPLSLWRKMLTQGLATSNSKTGSCLPADALALRIVIKARKGSPEEDPEVTRNREQALCYYVQQRCLEQWAPYSSALKDGEQAGRFKDYIKYPKPNGYQSLHYTATCGHNRPFEIQIRSIEMHHVAEYGVAAHCDYKLNTRKDALVKPSRSFVEEPESHLLPHEGQHFYSALSTDSRQSSEIPHVEELMDVHGNNVSLYLEALSSAKTALTRNVFVFLAPSSNFRTGKIVSMSAGSCIVDAMREGERQFGGDFRWRRKRVIVGREMTRRLQNGDVLAMSLS